ncbi:MAG: hypothetical protein HFH62_02445 [Lachnospiraceae bacterium]|nr:hypothetical protein [Lachnospiraceae bacterium]
MKELDFYLTEENMGAQYHQYLFGILLTNPKNKAFIYNNYMGMLVKHYDHSHVDFAFDGIYSCRENMVRQFAVRGPVSDLHGMIRNCIDNQAYVIINVNEEYLSKRQASHQHYFRHDLLIFGYDERKKTYRTVGFDEQFNYGITDYLWSEVELAYGTMQNEWDYEFFAFSVVDAYEEYCNFSGIKNELQMYLQGKNPIRTQLEIFLKGGGDSSFLNESYKNYYGIQAYDYLIDRIKGTHRHFLKIPCNEELGVNDIRSINALCGHIKIVEHMVRDVCGETELLQSVKNHEKFAYAGKLLFMNYLRFPDRRNGKKIMNHLRKQKEIEKVVIGDVIDAMSRL